ADAKKTLRKKLTEISESENFLEEEMGKMAIDSNELDKYANNSVSRAVRTWGPHEYQGQRNSALSEAEERVQAYEETARNYEERVLEKLRGAIWQQISDLKSRTSRAKDQIDRHRGAIKDPTDLDLAHNNIQNLIGETIRHCVSGQSSRQRNSTF